MILRQHIEVQIEPNETDDGAKVTFEKMTVCKLPKGARIWERENLFSIGISEAEYRALHILSNKTGKDICDVLGLLMVAQTEKLKTHYIPWWANS